MRFVRIKKRRDQKGTQVKLVKWNTEGLNRDKFQVSQMIQGIQVKHNKISLNDKHQHNALHTQQ